VSKLISYYGQRHCSSTAGVHGFTAGAHAPAGPTLAPTLHQSWLLHASTHLREIWTIFKKDMGIKS